MLVSHTLQSQQKIESSIYNLENQISQLATKVNSLEVKRDGRLPLQLEINPKNVCAMTLLGYDSIS